MKKTRRRYDREFKLQAVKLVEEKNQLLSEVARNLGININVLSRWRKEFREKSEKAFLEGPLTPEQIEIRRLKKELADVKTDRAILKKALAIFSVPQK